VLRASALIVVAVLVALLGARSAAAAPGLVVGATDDMFRTEPARAQTFAQDLGLTGRAARTSA
jgi:hypothetical protein